MSKTRKSKNPPKPWTDDSFVYWVQFVVGMVLVAWGAYFLGPWEAYQYSSVPAQSYQEEFMIGPIMAAVQVISGLACSWAAIKRNVIISNLSLGLVVLSYTVIVSMRIMGTGPFPMYWLFQLGLAIIAVLLMIRSGLKRHGA